MPQDDKERKVIYKKILAKKKEIHFAVEEIKMKDAESIEFVENIFLIKKTLPNCLSKF